jgi:hypothetical protein
MPKGKTGEPRGRPSGATSAQLRRDAVAIALSVAFQGNHNIDEIKIAELANLLAGGESLAEFAAQDGKLTFSLNAPARRQPNELRNAVVYTHQRLRGTKGKLKFNDADRLYRCAMMIVDLLEAEYFRIAQVIAGEMCKPGKLQWTAGEVAKLLDFAAFLHAEEVDKYVSDAAFVDDAVERLRPGSNRPPFKVLRQKLG